MSTENTGSPPAAPAAATVAAPPANVNTNPATSTGTPPAGDPKPQTVVIPIEQLNLFNETARRNAELDAELKRRDAEARAEQVKLHQARGETEKAMQLQQEEARRNLEAEKVARDNAEQRAKRYALDSELKGVLSGAPLVPGGADQLTELWRKQFIVDASGESYAVRTPTFQSVQDFVAAQLAKPEYAHFVRAQNPNGGTSGTGSSGSLASPTSPANPAAPPVPKTFGEAIVLQMQQMVKDQPSDARMNPAAAMGINPRSVRRDGYGTA